MVPDAIIECTGVGQVIADSIQAIGSSGTVCLTGVGQGGVTSLALGDIAASAVLKNNVIVGSVNANKRHWYKAGNLLARADRKWLSRLITRRGKTAEFQKGPRKKARRHQGRHSVLRGVMQAPNSQPFPWRLFLCELSGTAVLVLVGLSFVIGMFGTGSPMTQLIPNEGLRRLITGFLFGTTGASIALSAVGKESGAHIKPGGDDGVLAVPQARWADRGYLRSGAVDWWGYRLSAPAGLWREGSERSVWRHAARRRLLHQAVLLGEIVTTFTMVSLLVVFIGFRCLRPFTPGIFPPLYATMV